ncbi:MAG: hypothetical protein WAN48_05585 [Actinomycetes bacterium]
MTDGSPAEDFDVVRGTPSDTDVVGLRAALVHQAAGRASPAHPQSRASAHRLAQWRARRRAAVRGLPESHERRTTR